jgi:hypothetical protein
MTSLLLLLLISIFVFGGAVFDGGFSFAKKGFLARSVCDEPVEYRIGSVDERFNLTEEKLIAHLANAESIWEEPSSRNLFTYSEGADLTVNMVYDRRQSLHNEINALDEQLEQGRGDIEAKRQQYESMAADFERRLSEFNSEVESWNRQGGAPPDEYNRLIATQNELQADAAKLNEIAGELNLSASRYNIQVGTLNKRIREFNEDLRRRPEEGLFDGETNTIEIYFVPSENELIHTLAHEFGHALGIGHTENDSVSIMSPYSSESTKATTDDLGALGFACRDRSLAEIARDNYLLLIRNFQKRFL